MLYISIPFSRWRRISFNLPPNFILILASSYHRRSTRSAFSKSVPWLISRGTPTLLLLYAPPLPINSIGHRAATLSFTFIIFVISPLRQGIRHDNNIATDIISLEISRAAWCSMPGLESDGHARLYAAAYASISLHFDNSFLLSATIFTFIEPRPISRRSPALI